MDAARCDKSKGEWTSAQRRGIITKLWSEDDCLPWLSMAVANDHKLQDEMILEWHIQQSK